MADTRAAAYRNPALAVPQCRSCGAQATITHIQRHFEQPMMSFHSHLPEAPEPKAYVGMGP